MVNWSYDQLIDHKKRSIATNMSKQHYLMNNRWLWMVMVQLLSTTTSLGSLLSSCEPPLAISTNNQLLPLFLLIYLCTFLSYNIHLIGKQEIQHPQTVGKQELRNTRTATRTPQSLPPTTRSSGSAAPLSSEHGPQLHWHGLEKGSTVDSITCSHWGSTNDGITSGEDPGLLNLGDK